MTKQRKIKLLIEHLKYKGVCSSQADLGEKLGYMNESSFSQLVKDQNRWDILTRKIKSIYPDLNENFLLGNSNCMFLSELSKDESKQLENELYNRINELLEILDFSNFKQLSDKIGYNNPQLFFDLRSGKAKNISKDFLEKLKNFYPEINLRYLTDGEGDIKIDTIQGIESNDKTIKFIPDDLQTMTKRFRDYTDEIYSIEFSCQIKSSALRPFILEDDIITFSYTPKENLVNGRVYLIDTPTSKLIKRVEIQEDHYVLYTPFAKGRNYPTMVVSFEDNIDIDFYDLVSRVTNNVGNIFNEESADTHYLAMAAVEANKELIINERKAHDNVRIAAENAEKALSIIDKLTNK